MARTLIVSIPGSDVCYERCEAFVEPSGALIVREMVTDPIPSGTELWRNVAFYASGEWQRVRWEEKDGAK